MWKSPTGKFQQIMTSGLSILQSTASKNHTLPLSSLNDTTVALLHVILVDADTGLSISCIAAEPLPSVPKAVQYMYIHAAINEEPHLIQLSKYCKYESDFLSRITYRGYSVKDVVEVEAATGAQSKSS